MIAEEEFKALTAEHNKRQQQTDCSSSEQSVCLLALNSPDTMQDPAYFPQQAGQANTQQTQLCKEADVLGTLDLYAVQALQGQVLIGMLLRWFLQLKDLTAHFHNLQEAFDAESMSKSVLQPLLPCLQKLLILINQTPQLMSC